MEQLQNHEVLDETNDFFPGGNLPDAGFHFSNIQKCTDIQASQNIGRTARFAGDLGSSQHGRRRYPEVSGRWWNSAIYARSGKEEGRECQASKEGRSAGAMFYGCLLYTSPSPRDS